MSSITDSDAIAVRRFKEYLQIPSVHPNPDYSPIIDFVKKYADELGFHTKVVEVHPDKPVAIVSWAGENITAKSIILNGHTDVVPVEKDKWHFPPFGAEVHDGKIYARGSQDMKCVNIQYMEALRELKQGGFKPHRSIHVVFMPEEELGGHLGAELFVKTPEFKELNAGIWLDEGLASPSPVYKVYNRERGPWWVKATANGQPGHGSILHANTASVKIQNFMKHLDKFRNGEVFRLKMDTSIDGGDVTSVNMTMLNGGQQPNVVPATMTAIFDIRIPPNINLERFENLLNQWASESDVSIEYLQKTMYQGISSVSPDFKPWTAFKKGLDNAGIEIDLRSFVGATDARYSREAGVPSYNFSPMNNTPVLLHDHDEFLGIDTFLEGIKIYKHIIPSLVENLE